MSDWQGSRPPNIDVQDERQLARWSQELGATDEKIREAVGRVGPRPTRFGAVSSRAPRQEMSN